MTEQLPPFDPNGYRKRVLAAVERRGGPATADAFELYDLPVDVAVDDATAASRVAEVWAFWQRQRDHPRYRALVALLVETHARRSAELLDAPGRRAAAARAVASRAARDTERYALLDAAIERLVARHGGVPPDKVAGLVDVGALSGLTAYEVSTRVRRHRVLAPRIGTERRRQIRALLDEFARLTGVTSPPTLLAVLGLSPAATESEVAAGATAWRARARELPAGRLRAVVDELLVHVDDLLVPGRTAIAAYLDAVAEDVRDHLRPRVRAAVLVEDRLVEDDRAHLVAEAVERGLDERRAARVVAALAAEVDATAADASTRGDGDASGAQDQGSRPVDRSSRPEPESPGRDPGAPDRDPGAPRPDPTDLVRQARAALRAGRPRAARDLVDAAVAAGPAQASAQARQARALSDEITAVLAEASRRASRAAEAAADRRWVAALEHLDQLARTAADAVPDLEEHRSRARAEVARAQERVTAALAGARGGQEAALRAVLADCRDHAGARAALDALTAGTTGRATTDEHAAPTPPGWVSAARDGHGDVLVLWAPSTSDDVTYRVRRLRPDGSWQVVGRVPISSIEDGGAPPGVEAPVYAVSAIQAGRSSVETRSDSAPVPGDPPERPGPRTAVRPPAPAGPQAPVGVLAMRSADGTVDVTWTPVPGDAEYRVRRLDGDQWRVVGRTRVTRIQDGGAPAGLVPVYAVSAAVGGTRSGEGRSDGG